MTTPTISTRAADLEHRALAAFHALPRRYIYGAAIALVGTIVIVGAFGRALHNALDWNDDYATGRVIRLQDSVVVKDGHVIRVPYQGACPAAQYIPVDKKGRGLFDQFEIDSTKKTVIAVTDIPRADYGARQVTDVDKTTGEVGTKIVIANPRVAFENQWTIGGRALFMSTAGSAPFRVGGAWEPASFRAGPGRVWLSIGAGYLRTPGESGPYGELGLDWRIRGRKPK